MNVLDAIHGCTGADNVEAIRATDSYKADAERYRINVRIAYRGVDGEYKG